MQFRDRSTVGFYVAIVFKNDIARNSVEGLYLADYLTLTEGYIIILGSCLFIPGKQPQSVSIFHRNSCKGHQKA